MRAFAAPAFQVLKFALAGAMLAALTPPVLAQAWKPEKPVEIIVSCAPGCGPDNMARFMQRIFEMKRYFETPVAIQNKAGGGGLVARTYLNQFAANGHGHYLLHSDRGIIASVVMGRAPTYSDVTPISVLFTEYIGIAVRADSPIKSGRDLIERLKKDPAQHSFGIATSIGNTNHQGVAGALKTAGIDLRKTRNVVFQSGALAIIAMLGGHVDVVPVSLGSWVDHVKTGAVRVITVSSPERVPGFFSAVPTWREQGADVVVSNWRAMYGPRGMPPPQVAYWENTFQRLTDSPEWKAEIERLNATTKFMGSVAMKKYMDEEHAAIKGFLSQLELAKN